MRSITLPAMLGRRAQEDPLAGLGGTPTAAVMAEPAEGDGDGGGGLLVAFAVAAVAAVAVVLGLSERAAVRDPAEKALRGEVTGLTEHSLVRPENLARALRKVRAESPAGTTLSMLRLAPEGLDATVQDPNGAQRIVSVDAAFDTTDRSFGTATQPGLAFDRVDTAAPARMLRAVAGRTRADLDELNYLALTVGGSDRAQSWFLALRGDGRDRQWTADARGGDVRHPGELPRAERERIERQRRESEAHQRRARRRSRCVERASGPAEVDRCLRRFG